MTFDKLKQIYKCYENFELKKQNKIVPIFMLNSKKTKNQRVTLLKINQNQLEINYKQRVSIGD